MANIFDLLIIGGGINGAGIARDAAGRGLKVMLCDKDDLASATSSASSKLIHGGLRYLEHYEFRLVREALGEREVLLRAAPHIIWPLRFVLPYHSGMRPFWLLRCGLFLYDHLGGRKMLPPTRTVRLRRDAVGEPLDPGLTLGFEYSDCWVDDARLVVLNAMDAGERGALISTRTRCVGARRVDGVWQAQLQAENGELNQVRAAALVNAAGPWVQQVRDSLDSGGTKAGVRLVKGSHIVVPRLYPGEQAYTFQSRDGRVVFVLPYEGEFSLIGTTDLVYKGDPGQLLVTEEEIAYLCDVVRGYFKQGPQPADVVWQFAGVRPLYDDGRDDPSAVTRDYRLDLDVPPGGAPCLTIYGGKITTFRRLAEEAMDRLLPCLGRNGMAWTAQATLPGGDLPAGDFAGFLHALTQRYGFVAPVMLRRMARAYGSRAHNILAGARSMADLGRCFGGLVCEAELRYLRDAEWAKCADDVLWRRSKLGLHLDETVRRQVAEWFGEPG